MCHHSDKQWNPDFLIVDCDPTGFLAPEDQKPEKAPQNSPRNIEEDWRRENGQYFP